MRFHRFFLLSASAFFALTSICQAWAASSDAAVSGAALIEVLQSAASQASRDSGLERMIQALIEGQVHVHALEPSVIDAEGEDAEISSMTQGLYHASTQDIFLRPGLPRFDFALWGVHELAHFVFDQAHPDTVDGKDEEEILHLRSELAASEASFRFYERYRAFFSTDDASERLDKMFLGIQAALPDAANSLSEARRARGRVLLRIVEATSPRRRAESFRKALRFLSEQIENGELTQ